MDTNGAFQPTPEMRQRIHELLIDARYEDSPPRTDTVLDALWPLLTAGLQRQFDEFAAQGLLDYGQESLDTLWSVRNWLCGE